MKNLTTYSNRHNRHTVSAIFHGEKQVVFEGLSHSECLRWCHSNGLRMMSEDRWLEATQASFRKVNAKHQYDPSEYELAVLG